jgi:hypothetical protein
MRLPALRFTFTCVTSVGVTLWVSAGGSKKKYARRAKCVLNAVEVIPPQGMHGLHCARVEMPLHEKEGTSTAAPACDTGSTVVIARYLMNLRSVLRLMKGSPIHTWGRWWCQSLKILDVLPTRSLGRYLRNLRIGLVRRVLVSHNQSTAE